MNAIESFFEANKVVLSDLFDFFERLTIAGAIALAGSLAVIYPTKFFSVPCLVSFVRWFGYLLVVSGAFLPAFITFHFWHQVDAEKARNAKTASAAFKWISGLVGWPFFLFAALAAVLRIGQ